MQYIVIIQIKQAKKPNGHDFRSYLTYTMPNVINLVLSDCISFDVLRFHVFERCHDVACGCNKSQEGGFGISILSYIWKNVPSSKALK